MRCKHINSSNNHSYKNEVRKGEICWFHYDVSDTQSPDVPVTEACVQYVCR